MFDYIKNVNGNYVFSFVRAEKQKYAEKTGVLPIDLSVGDYCAPILKTVKKAYVKGVKEAAERGAKFGYPPTDGYGFLKKKIAEEYKRTGANVSENEIFITDGAKNDLFRIAAVSGKSPAVLCEPTYPVYSDASKFFGAETVCSPQDDCAGFIPLSDVFCGRKNGLLYLCSPSNPTGAVYEKKDVQRLISYAEKSDSVIVYDGAYSCFLNGNVFETLYNLKGAKSRVIEVHTLSKCARFTNLRLGFTVIPNELKQFKSNYTRLLSCAFNGVSYPLSRAGESVFSKRGKTEVFKNIAAVKEKAAYLKNKLSCVTKCFGGDNSPYLFARCPKGYSSVDFFKKLLYDGGVVGVPSSGFYSREEGCLNYVRFSAFANKSDVFAGAERIVKTYLSL